MLFNYQALTPEGEKRIGSIEAANVDIAISSLQRRNLIVVSVKSGEKQLPFFKRNIKFFERVKFREVVMFSRQLSTLFEAKVPIIDSLRLLSAESENPMLRRKLSDLVNDIQGGLSMSQAMAKYPEIFSKFYVNMVRSGEESGKLSEIFSFLADYLERSYQLSSKAKNALLYPAFVITSFLGVMILMMVTVIPRLSAILTEVGQEIPFYTRVVIGTSQFFVDFGIFLLIALSGGIFFLWRYLRTRLGKEMISRIQISIPLVGGIYKKIYISRIADNLETLLSSGVPVVRSLEITAEIVGNEVYRKILIESVEAVKAGNTISEIFSKYDDMPPLVAQMIKVGEESGKLNFILKTLGKFYSKEVDNTLENLVSLIEPIMIIVLGVGVGLLLVSVLGPIYNMTSAF